MSKNLMEAKSWANPGLGNIVLSAWESMPKTVSCDYRVLNMSARELLEAIGTAGKGMTISLTADRVWVHVEIDMSVKGTSPNTFGYVDVKVAKIGGDRGYWLRWMSSNGNGVYREA